LSTSRVQILLVDDFGSWRRLVASMFRQRPELEIICETSDGLEAVQKAEELQPDLILIDIGIARVNGLEATKQIRALSPRSKVIMVTQEQSADVVREAFRAGANGYVVKVDAGTELLTAIDIVLRGGRFLGPRFSSLALPEADSPALARSDRHEVGFYSDEHFLLDHLTQFIGTALKAGRGAIVVATEPHRNSLLLRLQGYGVNFGAAIEEGRFVVLDAAETLSAVMVHGVVDQARFLTLLGDRVGRVVKTATEEPASVAIFGECVQILWKQNQIEAAIQLEQVANQLNKTHPVDILCGYFVGKASDGISRDIFERICAEHSSFHYR
jgi:DNA-binding NarL/FixJ family response regulator